MQVLYTDQQLKQALQSWQVIPAQELDSISQMCAQTGQSLANALVDKGLLADQDILRIISEITQYPWVLLQSTTVDLNTLHLIPEVVARAQKAIAYASDEHGIHVALVNPNDRNFLLFLAQKTGKPVIPHVALEKDIQSALTKYSKKTEALFQNLTEKISQALKTGDQIPVVELVDTIIKLAVHSKASDIHIEPQEKTMHVRYRIDGNLHDIVTLPKVVHDAVVMRLKVLANLRTDEHLTPQDGKLSVQVDETSVDIRLSTVPITEGEKAVMRLLSDSYRSLSLQDLGLQIQDLVKIENAKERPYGMILVTGPTGSGKTTSLYALLKLLNNPNVNIMTIEDPVEYKLEGINQIQVNTQTGLTFSSGLRSIVRQDPNIILVGEIRDEETAGIAINSAMTGHLVLSTLHTNDAATTFPRLFDMGIEPYLVASAVSVVVGQRLVKRICMSCRVSVQADTYAQEHSLQGSDVYAQLGPATRIYKGKGCPVCHMSGYEGRVGLFEVLVVTDSVREAIARKAPSHEIQDLAQKEGMTNMLKDGILKVQQGLTTLDEVVRATLL